MTRDELTCQWWTWCEKNQRQVDRIPTFGEWLQQQGIELP